LSGGWGKTKRLGLEWELGWKAWLGLRGGLGREGSIKTTDIGRIEPAEAREVNILFVDTGFMFPASFGVGFFLPWRFSTLRF
jgi:hypothetical protein